MDVFISYAREDAGLAEPLKGRLEALGLTCFFDLDDGIHSGDTFPQRIADAVRQSKAVVACWTPYALTRVWCRRECFIAQELGKLVPVALKPLQPSDRVEFIDVSFEDLTEYDFKGPHLGYSQTLRSLAAKLDGWAEANPDKPVAEALARAAALRAEAIRLKPLSRESSSTRVVGIEAVWASVDKDDPVALLNFAESFTGSPRAYEARQRISEVIRMTAAFEALDFDSRQALETFLAAYAVHPRRAQVQSRRDELKAEELEVERQALAKALAERVKKEEEERVRAERLARQAKRNAEVWARWGWLLGPTWWVFGNAHKIAVACIALLIGGDLLPGDLPFLRPLTEIERLTQFSDDGAGSWVWNLVFGWVVYPALFLIIGPFIFEGAWPWTLAYLVGAFLIAGHDADAGYRPWKSFGLGLLKALVAATCIIHFSPEVAVWLATEVWGLSS